MDIDAIRAKMASYLDSLSPNSAVEEFEKRGYNLEYIPDKHCFGVTAYTTTHAHPLGKNAFFKASESKKQGKNLAFFI